VLRALQRPGARRTIQVVDEQEGHYQHRHERDHPDLYEEARRADPV